MRPQSMNSYRLKFWVSFIFLEPKVFYVFMFYPQSAFLLEKEQKVFLKYVIHIKVIILLSMIPPEDWSSWTFECGLVSL